VEIWATAAAMHCSQFLIALNITHFKTLSVLSILAKTKLVLQRMKETQNDDAEYVDTSQYSFTLSQTS